MSKSSGQAKRLTTPEKPLGDAGPPKDQEPSLALKAGVSKAPSPAPVGLPRSPLVMAQVRPAGEAQEVKAPTPPPAADKADKTEVVDTSKEPAALRPISQINGLLDSEHDLPQDASAVAVMTHVMYDPTPAWSRQLMSRGLIVLTVLGTLAMLTMPELRREVVRRVKTGKNEMVRWVRPQQRKTSAAGEPSEGADPRARRPVPLVRPLDLERTAPRRSCDALFQAAGNGQTLLVAERVDLAECFLGSDDPGMAVYALKPLRSHIRRAGESRLNGLKTSRTLVDAQHSYIAALLKEGRVREAGELVEGQCLRWSQTNTCVGKLMVLAEQQVPLGEQAQRLFERTGALDAKAQARLWLAGAKVARTEGRMVVADQRYDRAAATAPKEALALKKTIYEMQVVDLYHRGEFIKMRAQAARGVEELKALSRSGQLKLRMLHELVTAADKAKAVRGFLNNEGILVLARRDPEVLDILGLESLRWGLEKAFEKLVGKTREQLTARGGLSNPVLRQLSLWQVRMLMAQGDFARVLGLLASYETAYGPDPVFHHLRGVAYHRSSAHPKSQLLAVAEFQAAVRRRPHWESLYALGVALIRSGRPNQVAAVIKELERTLKSPGQRYWTDMLKCEWYLEKGKLLNAQKLAQDWMNRGPDFVTPRQLLVRIHQKAKRDDEARTAEVELDQVLMAPGRSGSFESLSSPLGAMALGRRPID